MNTLLFFASVKPKRYGHLGSRNRLSDYSVAIERLKYFVNMRSDWNILVVENTLLDRPTREMRRFKNAVGSLETLFLAENSGVVNKGYGELDMLDRALDHLGNSLFENRMVAYMTGRRLLVNPYVLDRVDNCSKHCIVGNPDFLSLRGHVQSVAKGQLLNDMFFAMSPELIVGYRDHYLGNKKSMEDNNWSSEHLLWRFVNQNDVDHEWIDALGMVRRDDLSLREQISHRTFGLGRWRII